MTSGLFQEPPFSVLDCVISPAQQTAASQRAWSVCSLAPQAGSRGTLGVPASTAAPPHKAEGKKPVDDGDEEEGPGAAEGPGPGALGTGDPCRPRASLPLPSADVVGITTNAGPHTPDRLVSVGRESSRARVCPLKAALEAWAGPSLGAHALGGLRLPEPCPELQDGSLPSGSCLGSSSAPAQALTALLCAGG